MWNKLTIIGKYVYNGLTRRNDHGVNIKKINTKRGGVRMFGKIKAMDVAKWILNKNNYMQNVTDTENITNMKLQKLLYYAQGLHLAKFGKPLFKDYIYAWEHGPVVKEVYHNFKTFGGDGIIFPGELLNVFTPEQEELLEKVYEEYGQYSAWKLRNMTHDEKPWKSTVLNGVISTTKMQDYFKETKHGQLY